MSVTGRVVEKEITKAFKLLQKKRFKDAFETLEKISLKEEIQQIHQVTVIIKLFMILAFLPVEDKTFSLSEDFIIDTLDELISYKDKGFKDYNLAEVLNTTGCALYKANYDKIAVLFLEKALALADKEKEVALIIQTATNLAYSHLRRENFTKAGRTFEILASLSKGKEENANFLENAAWSYYLQGTKESNNKALAVGQTALKYFNQKKLKKRFFRMALFVSDVFQEQANEICNEKIENALAMVEKTIIILEGINLNRIAARASYAGGVMASNNERPGEAYKYFHYAFKQALKEGVSEIILLAALRAALLLISQKRFTEAVVLLEEAIEASSLLPDSQTDLLSKAKKLLSRVQTYSNSDSAKEQKKDELIKEETLDQPSTQELTSNKEIETVLEVVKSTPVQESTEEVEQQSEQIATSYESPPLDDVPMELFTDGFQSHQPVSTTRESVLSTQIEGGFEEIEEPIPETQEISFQEESARPTTQQAQPSTRDDLDNAKLQIMSFLRRKGYQIESNYVPFNSRGVTIDIVGIKGAVFKSKVFIIIASNPADANISTFLLRGISEHGRKVIYLIDGSTLEVFADKDIQVVRNISEIMLR